MFKVFFLIFETGLTWDRIASARSGVVKILLLHLLPLVVLAGYVEGAGLLRWGRVDPETLRVITFSKNDVLTFEAIQFTLALGAVFLSAILIRVMAGAFHGRNGFARSFALVAYGLSPLFLFRMGDAFPQISPWATWGAGIALSIWILYQGIPRLLQPDPTSAFGLYLTVSFNILAVTGLGRGITALYLARHIHHLGHHLGHHLENHLEKLLPGGHF